MVLLTLFLLSFAFNGECTPRPFHEPAMCLSDRSTDCSFQLSGDENAFCKVYSSSVCRNFDFSGWMRHTSYHPVAQSDSIYEVALSPYVLSNVVGLPPGSRDAVNVTLTTSDTDVDGYVLTLENSVVNWSMCRIFDLRNSVRRSHANLFYDCVFGVVNTLGVRNFSLKVTVLPHNEEMLYTLYLPDESDTEANDICQWKPLVMVFNGGFQNNIVEVKFSQAPNYFRISSYEVSLLSPTSTVPVQKTTVKATEGKLLSSMFSHVDRGYYSIYVRPLSSNSSHSCDTTRYTAFFIENKLIDKIIIIYILVICFTGVAVAISVLLVLWWLFKPGPISPHPVALLVYSYDCKEHNMTVLRIAKFLKKQGGMEVLTIYGEQSTDPDMWLFGPYRNCDVVIIIISEGVFHKCEKGNSPPLKEGYPCGDRLILSLSFLRNNMLSDEKKFIPVYFEYSGTCHIPSSMQLGRWEKAFVIPREMNRLLCQVYDQNPKIPCLGIYPRMPGHDVASYPEGMALIDEIENVKQVLNRIEFVSGKHGDESDSCQLSTAEKDNLRNTEMLGKFSESRHTKNCTADEENGYAEPNFQQSVLKKQWYYNDGHRCNEENCTQSQLLKNNGECKVNLEFIKQDVQENSALDALHNTEEVSTDRHLQDLEYIFSKPGPSFPHIDSLKFTK